ncbi:MAG: hypothetical protein V7638_3915 [Acidobacteriota bacterium]|jgi:hypothetical protein
MRFCNKVKIGNSVGFVCGHEAPRRKCQFCRQRPGENQCDFLTGGKCRKCKGHGERSMDKTEQQFHTNFAELLSLEGDDEKSMLTREQAAAGMEALTASLVCYWCAGKGKAMCNRYFCGVDCGIRISDKEGYCPDHCAAAGHPKKLTREQCHWILDTALQPAGKCLRQKCRRMVQVDERRLLFPKRGRVMCAPCGEEYLRLTEQTT